MEKQVANDLLGESVEFSIGKRKYGIKKLKLGTIIRVSKEVLNMQELNLEQTAIQSIFTNAVNLKYAARIIALSIINSRWSNWSYRILAKWLMYKLDNAELAQLMKVVAGQIGAQDFFFTMTLTKGMNLMRKRKDELEAGELFTEPLP